MKHLLRSLSVLALMGFVASCTPTDEVTNSSNAPTGLGATAINSTTIGLKWTRATGDVTADTITVKDAAGATAFTGLSSGNTAQATGLSLDKEYTITVSGGGGSASMKYATAMRSTILRLWETADNQAGHYSGLVLHDAALNAPRAASTTGSDSINVDVVLASDPTNTELPYMSLRSADASGTGIQANGKSTRFNTTTTIVKGGMDSLFYSSSDAVIQQLTGTANNWDMVTIGSTNVTNMVSAVVLVKTADNHYARVEVIPQTNGQLYGEAPDSKPGDPATTRYVDVKVSYQPDAGWAYVGRARPIARSGNQPLIKSRTVFQ